MTLSVRQKVYPESVGDGEKGRHFRRSWTEPMEPPFGIVMTPEGHDPAAVRGGGLDRELGKDAGKYSTAVSKSGVFSI